MTPAEEALSLLRQLADAEEDEALEKVIRDHLARAGSIYRKWGGDNPGFWAEVSASTHLAHCTFDHFASLVLTDLRQKVPHKPILRSPDQ